MEKLYADLTVSISEFKSNPGAMVEKAEGLPLAVMSHNRVAFYAITPDLLHELVCRLEAAEGVEYLKRISERLSRRDQAIFVNVNDL
jgi:antitoxin StbD